MARYSDLDKLRQSAGGRFGSIDGGLRRLFDPLGYGGDTIGAEVGDITSELLADAIQLTHPDKHPPERKDLAKRVTAELLALKPYVFPAPKPEPAPTYRPSDGCSNSARTEIGKPSSKPPYPCDLCADTTPSHYCDACKAEYEKEQQRKRERKEKERQQRNARQRQRYAHKKYMRDSFRFFDVPPPACLTCGERLKDKRNDAKYCSAACRQRAYLKRDGKGSNAKPTGSDALVRAIKEVFEAEPDSAFKPRNYAIASIRG